MKYNLNTNKINDKLRLKENMFYDWIYLCDFLNIHYSILSYDKIFDYLDILKEYCLFERQKNGLFIYKVFDDIYKFDFEDKEIEEFKKYIQEKKGIFNTEILLRDYCGKKFKRMERIAELFVRENDYRFLICKKTYYYENCKKEYFLEKLNENEMNFFKNELIENLNMDLFLKGIENFDWFYKIKGNEFLEIGFERKN